MKQGHFRKIDYGSLILVTALLTTITACKQSALKDSGTVNPSSLSNNGDVLDDGVRNQKPKIHCELKRQGQSAPFKILDTDYNLDKTMGEAQRDDTITFDCSKTTDDQSVGELKFKYDFGIGQVLESGAIASQVYSQVSENNVTITVTDALGSSQVKAFTLLVQCKTADMNPISIADNAVSISAGARVNEFNYSIDPSAITGGPLGGMSEYIYSWDFNGDGYPDNYGTPAAPYISQTTASNVYMNFANSKEIGILVYEKNCRIYSSKYFAKSFSIARVPANTALAGGLPAPKPNFFLQGDIRSLSSSPARHEEGDFIVQNRASDSSSQKRVTCSYRRSASGANDATFLIDGLNWYGDRTTATQMGISVKVVKIADDGRAGRQVFDLNAVNRPVTENVKYYTPDVKDVMKRVQYSGGAANCQVEIAVTRSQGVVPCSGGLTGTVEPAAVFIEGKYSCTSLNAEDNSGRKIKIDQGYFYCEQGPLDQCSGGGGGGGVSPPKT